MSKPDTICLKCGKKVSYFYPKGFCPYCPAPKGTPMGCSKCVNCPCPHDNAPAKKSVAVKK